MTYFPFALPESATQDRSETEAPPTTPFLLGTITNFENDLQSLPITEIGRHVARLYNDNFNKGQFLDPQEAKEKYPNVSFPEGGYENEVASASDSRSLADYNNDLISNMKPGLVSGLGKTTTMLAANAIDPIGWLGGIGVEKTVGRIGAELVSKIATDQAASATSKAASLLSKGVVGATEGGLISSPFAIGSADYYHQIQMPYSKWNTAKMIGAGALFGSALRTAIGFKKVMPTDFDNTATFVANEQLAAGKKVDLEPVITEGMARAQKADENFNPDLVMEETQKLQNQLSNVNQSLENERNNYTELTKGKKNVINPDIGDISGPSLVNKALNISSVAPELISDEDKSFMKSLPNTDEIKAAGTYKLKAPEELTKNEQKFLERFNGGDEQGLLTDRLDRHQNEISRINKKLDKLKPEEVDEREKLLNQKDTLDNKIDDGRGRLKELRRFRNEPAKIKVSRENIISLKNQQRELAQQIEDSNAYLAVRGKSVPSLDQEQIKNAMNRVNSAEGEFTYDPKEFQQQEEISKKPEISDKEIADEDKASLEQQLTGKDFPKDIVDDFNEVDDLSKDVKDVNSALRNFFKCIIR